MHREWDVPGDEVDRLCRLIGLGNVVTGQPGLYAQTGEPYLGFAFGYRDQRVEGLPLHWATSEFVVWEGLKLSLLQYAKNVIKGDPLLYTLYWRVRPLIRERGGRWSEDEGGAPGVELVQFQPMTLYTAQARLLITARSEMRLDPELD